MHVRNLLTWPWIVIGLLLALACLAVADDYKISSVMSHVENDVLMAVEFDVTDQDVAGPHPKRRYLNDPCIRLKVQDYRGSGYDKAHGRALSLTLDPTKRKKAAAVEDEARQNQSNVHTTLNLWPATPHCNRVLMREVERYIEWAAPVRVKITAQYDGEGPFIGPPGPKGEPAVEVPDAFVYEITNSRIESRFFVPNTVSKTEK